jgi:hypothetical protein
MCQGRSIERVSARGAWRDGRGGPHESGRACEGTWHSGRDARAGGTRQSEHPRRLAERLGAPVSRHDDRLPAVHGAGLASTVQVRSSTGRASRTAVVPSHLPGVAVRSARGLIQPAETCYYPSPTGVLPEPPTRTRETPWLNPRHIFRSICGYLSRPCSEARPPDGAYAIMLPNCASLNPGLTCPKGGSISRYQGKSA